MPRYVLRVWLPDVPGALGVLATRIGEAAGEIVGIDILERDGARAVDELTIELADAVLVGPLVDALVGLEGVDVEDVRALVSRLPFPGANPLDAAVSLVGHTTSGGLLDAFAHSVCSVFACDWASILDLDGLAPLAAASAGDAPSLAWLGAFVTGARASSARPDGSRSGPRDVAWAALESAGLVVVCGRDGPPFASRERRELTQLCRLVDARWRDLSVRAGMASHPSGASETPKAQQSQQQQPRLERRPRLEPQPATAS